MTKFTISSDEGYVNLEGINVNAKRLGGTPRWDRCFELAKLLCICYQLEMANFLFLKKINFNEIKHMIKVISFFGPTGHKFVVELNLFYTPSFQNKW